jgi:hypothetical protein
MGYVIKDAEILKAKKVVLSKADKKVVFTQTEKQKEVLENAKKRRELLSAVAVIDSI